MSATTTTLSALVRRCVHSSSVMRARAFSTSASSRQDAEPQSKGIPLALDFGGISIAANAPFARRLAENRLASNPRPSGADGRTKSPWTNRKSNSPPTANADRANRSNANNERQNNNNAQTTARPNQRFQRNRSNFSSSNSPRTTTNAGGPDSNNSSSAKSNSGSGDGSPGFSRVTREGGSSFTSKANNEHRFATTRAPAAGAQQQFQQQPRNGDAMTRTTTSPRRGAVAFRSRGPATQQSPSGQQRAGGNSGRVRSSRRRKAGEASANESASAEARTEMDTKIRALAPSFPSLGRALASGSAVVGPPGAGGSLLQSSSYDKFRITSLSKPTLVRYPNIVATARLALTRHRGIRFRDRRDALRVVKKLTERGGSFAKVQAN